MTPNSFIVATISTKTADFMNVLPMIVKTWITVQELPFTICHLLGTKESVLLTKPHVAFPDLGVPSAAIGERTERRHRHIEGVFLHIVVLMPPLKS